MHELMLHRLRGTIATSIAILMFSDRNLSANETLPNFAFVRAETWGGMPEKIGLNESVIQSIEQFGDENFVDGDAFPRNRSFCVAGQDEVTTERSSIFDTQILE